MAPNTTSVSDLVIAELSAAVAAVLADGYDGVRSGRVRQLPDARTIRWYQTLGMVDRPAAFRGRTALFSRRHVLQLAAIKRLQAAGHPLADIQRGMAGKTDVELARAAGKSLAEVERCIAAIAAARGQASMHAALAAGPTQAAKQRSATTFWKARPRSTAEVSPPPAATAGHLQSIALGDQAAVVWSGRPLTASERDLVARLARPLIEFLSSRVPGGAEPAGDPVGPSPRQQQEKGAR